MTTYTYQGNGDSLPGIPARDLGERDIARLTGAQVKTLEASGLYTKPAPTTEPKSTEPKGKRDAKPATD